MKKSEINFRNIKQIEFDDNNNPAKIFGTHLDDYIQKLEQVSKEDKTTIKNYIAGSIGVDTRSVENWCNPSYEKDIKVSSVVKFAMLSDMTLDELLTNTEVNIDEAYAKRIGLPNVCVKAIIDRNREITWNNEFKHTMEKLHLNPVASDMMANTYSHDTKRPRFLLWEGGELITVTLSQLLNYCVQKESYILDILTQLSDILNLLDDWKNKKDRSELIQSLKKYSIQDEDAYIEFKDSINDDESLKNELNDVEKNVTIILEKMVKEFILDEFRNLPSEKGEKNSNSI